MMVPPLIYAYRVGPANAHKIEKTTCELIPFRVLKADQHLNHDTIAELSRRHLEALTARFIKVRFGPNASEYNAMSYA
jgi:hypothetical protein